MKFNALIAACVLTFVALGQCESAHFAMAERGLEQSNQVPAAASPSHHAHHGDKKKHGHKKHGDHTKRAVNPAAPTPSPGHHKGKKHGHKKHGEHHKRAVEQDKAGKKHHKGSKKHHKGSKHHDVDHKKWERRDQQ
ncbi:unnamed protein product [Absidia cylindrospora]